MRNTETSSTEASRRSAAANNEADVNPTSISQGGTPSEVHRTGEETQAQTTETEVAPSASTELDAPVELGDSGNEAPTSWWARPCGGREVVQLAFPLVVSTISWTLMNFIDRTFLTWFDKDAMAAAMPAGAVSFSAICLPMGVASYVGTFVAQYNGSKQYHKMGLIVWQGVWLAVAAVPLFFLLHQLAPALFSGVGHPEGIANYEIVYFRALQFGAPAVVIAAATSGFFSGREETSVIMKVDASTSLLNVVLDYLWIFGYFGFPQMGIVGAALATVVSSWIRVFIYLALMFRRDRDSVDVAESTDRSANEITGQFGVRADCRFDWPMMTRLIRYGGPNGLQMFIEMSAFSAYLLLVGTLGTTELAATTLAFNVNQIAFVPLLGLGFAVSILVGNQIGKQRPDLASRATFTTLTIALGYGLVMAALYWLVPGAFLVLHELGADAEEFAEIRDMTVILLRFVAVYCIVDAGLIVFASAIKGAGDTKFVLIAAMIMSPIPVILGWIGIHRWNWTINHFWVLITIWIFAQGLVYFGRFMQGKWRTMKVVELADA